MGRYLVKLNELNDENRYIHDNISNIKEHVSTIQHLLDETEWTSPTNQKLTHQYKEYVQKLTRMINNLESCLDITKQFHNNYDNGYKKIKNDFQILSEEEEKKWTELM